MKKQPRREPTQAKQLRQTQLDHVQGGATQPIVTTASARDANLFS
jgi:hypothetical protein